MKILSNWNWTPPDHWLKIETIDLHTGGEPLRVITGGLPEVKGTTILEKRRYFKENLDYIRTGLMYEPRGHADMYGAVITDPISDQAAFGTFFLHNEGYSTMCGHAIIALGKLMLDTGILPQETTHIKIDAPPGLIEANIEISNGIVTQTSFVNVPSFVLMKDQQVDVEGIGTVTFDVAYGGAFYAFCDADQLGISMRENNANQLIDWGRKIKKAVMSNYTIEHPTEEDLSFLYGTIFTGRALSNKDHHSRNVCIFADGELDRSATGSGVSARAAIHYDRGEISIDESITIESILGTTMDVKVVSEEHYHGYDGVRPYVSGTAHITGKNTFYFDPTDPLKEGFLLR